MSLLPKRKRLRLPHASYSAEACLVHLTICTRDRSPVLVHPELAAAIQAELATRRVDASVYVWCLMPDHLHVVLLTTPPLDVMKWVRAFKGRSAATARTLGIPALWQRSYHDRVLTDERDLIPTCQYVLDNPVRKGLVTSWLDWPHRGSQEWELDGWLDWD